MTAYEYLVDAIGKHNSDACLLWPFKRDKDGYGRLSMPKRLTGKKLKVAAHRAAFWIVRGRWPIPNGLHSCDNPACFNPRHITEGTNGDNHVHQKLRGRTLKGTQQSQAKLTEEIVAKARGEYIPRKVGYGRLARKYGVSKPVMTKAIQGICSWKHVEREAVN